MAAVNNASQVNYTSYIGWIIVVVIICVAVYMMIKRRNPKNKRTAKEVKKE
jgi:large-conductance mechanosensitive channel